MAWRPPAYVFDYPKRQLWSLGYWIPGGKIVRDKVSPTVTELAQREIVAIPMADGSRIHHQGATINAWPRVFDAMRHLAGVTPSWGQAAIGGGACSFCSKGEG